MVTFKKIAGPLRIEADVGGADREYAIEASSGGRACKVVQFMVKVLSNSTNAKVGIKIKHGPDGQAFITHTSVASSAVPTEKLFVFDGANTILGEWIQAAILAGGTTPSDFPVVEIFEMRKPF